MLRNIALVFSAYVLLSSCGGEDAPPPPPAADALKPAVTTEKVYDDTDDPAIWINKLNPDSSLIVGTDKHVDSGGLFVFNLQGKIMRSLSRTGMKRVNNVDIAYGLKRVSGLTDIAVCTERDKNAIRVFSLPDMKEIDGGGIKVFSSSTDNLPMGISLYTRPSDSAIFAIVGRKSGPKEGYLEQYLLKDSAGIVVGELVRSFGAFSGLKEIESIAVDNELGFVYYSDEQFGVRKYYADPAKGNAELAVFGKKEFSVDNEGISIYKLTDSTGYILVSDQGYNSFNIYPREGEQKLLARVPVSAIESDGSDVTSVSLPGFEGGLFVAMSTDGTFQYYKWTEIAKKAGLKIK